MAPSVALEALESASLGNHERMSTDRARETLPVDAKRKAGEATTVD
jgi:hypothetical protein